MCGITGFFDSATPSKEELSATIQSMCSAILHRGPDDHSHFTDSDSGVTLGFQRLAILDLTEDGRQPMASPCGRYVITFNGEIYNYKEIRKRIEGEAFENLNGVRGHSDTAVILAAIRTWGFEAALKKLVGMFAIALWDRKEQVLFLARDRAGEKPLYYGWNNGLFLYGSELKTLKAHTKFKPTINESAFEKYVFLNQVPAPLSIYNGVFKLLPGHYVALPLAQLREKPTAFDPETTPKSYWSPPLHLPEGVISEDSYLDQLHALLRHTIEEQMVADVPVGAFLSGGIDSSLIVSLMAEKAPEKVKTFTIGFAEEFYNEAPFAAQVAKHIGTEHHELIVTPQMSLAVIPKLPTLYDEPFADSSQIPTYLVSELARKTVTVSLSGDGGDELFGGYSRYFYADSIWRTSTRFPGALTQALGHVTNLLSHNEKVEKLSRFLKQNDLNTLYSVLMTNCAAPEDLIARNGATPPRYLDAGFNRYEPLEQFMRSDFYKYLPNDILVKVDRASMGVSLESRAPFLDHRVIEFAWNLPLHLKCENGKGKLILRELLKRYLPAEMMERPKMGFGLPVDYWIRHELKDWAWSLLAPGHLSPLWNAKEVTKKWQEHLSGKHNWQYLLWNVLMFEAWRKERGELRG